MLLTDLKTSKASLAGQNTSLHTKLETLTTKCRDYKKQVSSITQEREILERQNGELSSEITALKKRQLNFEES